MLLQTYSTPFFGLKFMLILKYSLKFLSLHSCWYLIDVKLFGKVMLLFQNHMIV
jgi:hypothetical protein